MLGSFSPRSQQEYEVCFVPVLVANSSCDMLPRSSFNLEMNFLFILVYRYGVDKITTFVLHYLQLLGRIETEPDGAAGSSASGWAFGARSDPSTTSIARAEFFSESNPFSR